MSIDNTSEKSVDLDRQENVTKGKISAKKVALYYYDANTDTLQPYTNNTVEVGEETFSVLNNINDAVAAVAGAKGVLSDLRVSIVSGSVGLTAAQTLGTLTNITQLGGYTITQVPQNAQNQTAIQSNINNVIIS